MAAVFKKLFDVGHKNIVLIGGDLPPVPLRYFAEAYNFLATRTDALCWEPSRDGGYYLVGCNQPTPQIFEGMSWSQSLVLAQTLERLAALRIDFHLLPSWFDIDTPDDLRHLQSVLDSTLENAMANTATLLQRLGLEK